MCSRLEAKVTHLEADEALELAPPSAWRGQGCNCLQWNKSGASTAVPAETDMGLACAFRTHKKNINRLLSLQN